MHLVFTRMPGDSGLLCCTCVMYFKHKFTPLLVQSQLICTLSHKLCKHHDNHTLEPSTNTFYKQVYIHYRSNVLSTFSWLEPLVTPAWHITIRIAKVATIWSSHPSQIISFIPWAKTTKSFHGVLCLCLVMVHHQTNLGCKSFSISENLVATNVALVLKTNISVTYSGSWWCITIPSLIDPRYCLDKHSLKFQTFIVTVTLNTAKKTHKTL